MKSKKVYLGLSLFFLGLMGMLSMLTVDFPMPEEMQSILEEKFTPSQIQWLILINPTIIMLIAVIVGTLLYQKVNLSVPILEKMVGLKEDSPQNREILIYGILGGLLTGIVLTTLGLLGRGLVPSEFEQLGEALQITLAARFLYGGITEEILMRFGLMTLLVWIAAKIFTGIKPSVYWAGIILAALLFALGHFPIVFQSIDNPSSIMLAYVLIGNSLGGLVFGWLYWKKGLESAFLAHVFAHVAMVILEKIFL
jgi:hypothetical protein